MAGPQFSSCSEVVSPKAGMIFYPQVYPGLLRVELDKYYLVRGSF
jgi:hypothetical protein